MFNAEKTTNDIINFIRDYYKKHNLKGAVLGISGGKDSGVVAGLMVKAIGAENVVGLKLPCHSSADDSNLADLVSSHYGFKLYNCDLTQTFDSTPGNFRFCQNISRIISCNTNIFPIPHGTISFNKIIKGTNHDFSASIKFCYIAIA